MKTIRLCLTALLLTGTCMIANAQMPRTWISGVGDDANPCSRTATCKTFAGAFSKTSAGGEIDALDPNSTPGLNITKSITIDGGATGGIASIQVTGANGIVVNAGAGNVVTLRNLSIKGTAAANTHGIKFVSGKALHIENCTITGFGGRGIDIEPTAGGQVFVLNTISRDNVESGIRAIATSKVFITIDRSRFENNAYGVWAGDFSRFVMTDSDASGNSNAGLIAQANAGDTILNAINSTAANNVVSGIQAGGGVSPSIVRLAEVSIISNAVNGLVTGTNGSIVSFGGNYNSGSGLPTASVPVQ